MILQALTQYYKHLEEIEEVASPGWDKYFKVSYGLLLNDKGELIDILDLTNEKKTEKGPSLRKVPFHSKRTSGVLAFFLCDNASYLLGIDDKGKPDRAKKTFEAAKCLHHRLLDEVDSTKARAILAYFDSWKPEDAEKNSKIASLKSKFKGANFLFYVNDLDPVTNDSKIAGAWNNYYNSQEDSVTRAQCLVTGFHSVIAKVHPAIKGISGAQSSGAALVSFNTPSLNSYNHEQGENAPVSKYAAFAYTTALNKLISDKEHKKYIGDTTVIFWSQSAQTAYQDAFDAMTFDPQDSEHVSEQEIFDAIKYLVSGKKYVWHDKTTLYPEEDFYILGISPNAARLSVRFFLHNNYGSFVSNIMEHYDRLEITKPENKEFPVLSPFWLLKEVTNSKSANPAPPPQLAGDVLRSILSGGRYPETLINSLMIRIRSDRKVNWKRAAIIKAYYLRNSNKKCPKEVLTVELNKESAYLPYVLGRLFAVLEKIQERRAERESGKLNSTIKDKYFNTASATPAVIFPLLINLAQKHLRKLDDSQKIYYERLIANLIEKIKKEYPTRMTLPEQGTFQLGYYHQIQELYTPNKERKND